MGPNGEEMETAVIITTAATGELARLHERTPVIVPPDAFDLWLDCGKVDALTAAGALFVPPRRGCSRLTRFRLRSITPRTTDRI